MRRLARALPFLVVSTTASAGPVVDLDAPSSPSPSPTSAAAHALNTFDEGHWSDAAIELEAVTSGTTGDAPRVKELAQFDLGIALYRLKLFQASFGVFSEITTNPRHPMFDATLPWLAHLSEVLPEPANVIERIGKYRPDELAAFKEADDPLLYSELNYLLGRYDASAKNFDGAIARFDEVARESPHYVEAKFFTGIANVVQRRAGAAIGAFLDMERAVDSGSSDVEDASRMRDLGNLSLARTYYSASAERSPTGSVALDPEKLTAAVAHWNKIDETSELWIDAQFEVSWAYFMAGDAPRAMGNIHTVESPYFPSGLYPEADVLKAIVYFSECNYPEATAAADAVGGTYTPIRKKLEALYASRATDDADTRFFDLATRVHEGTAALDADIAPVVRHALHDRELARSIDYVRLLDDERARLSRMTPAFRSAPIGSDVSDALDLARAVAIKKAGSLARDRLRRTIDDLDKQLRGAQEVLFEVADTQRRNLEAEMSTIGGRAVPLRLFEPGVIPDDEHEVWPFDGEYWRDELGTYRQAVVSKCRR